MAVPLAQRDEPNAGANMDDIGNDLVPGVLIRPDVRNIVSSLPKSLISLWGGGARPGEHNEDGNGQRNLE